nr:CS1-pili formation C-terminal domain-containing protein [Pseudomonas sp. RIT-PI-S]
MAQASAAGPASLDLLSQARGLPAEFRDHFFDVPVVVRVDLNGRYLGDAMLLLGRDETVQLLKYSDIGQTEASAEQRQAWLQALSEPRTLGDCARDCPNGLVALHYSLERSTLSILTGEVERDSETPRFHQLPERSGGLLLRNQLNLAGSESQRYGTWVAAATGSIGQWTTVAEGQVDNSRYEGVSLDRHRLRSLYADHLQGDRFFRLGYFSPAVQGLSRQPRTLSGRPEGTLGVMFGSSDSLAVDNAQPSASPVYVTPNRPATVQVYRDGSLIYSQPVQPGLQAIDTRPLPGGIYEVEVRVVEDGQVTATTNEFIYKPSGWKNPEQRWRYNAYLGQGRELLSDWDDRQGEGMNAGVIANYMLHPQAILGLSAEHVDARMQYGLSLDTELSQGLRLFGNLYRTEDRGDGIDAQAIYTYRAGNLMLTHNRSWLYYEAWDDRVPAFFSARRRWQVRENTQTALTWQHRFTARGAGTARLTHDTGPAAGTGLDLSWIQRSILFGSEGYWRFSVFDRPGSDSSGNRRSRGVDVSLTLALGSSGDQLTGTVGTRTDRDGSREQTATLNYRHQLAGPFLRSVTGTLNSDSYGLGVGGRAEFLSQAAAGDLYLQTSSYNGELGGGLNLSNTLALGEGHLASSGDFNAYGAGMIVDVDSDLADVELRTYDEHGISGRLVPGRNVIPVTPYEPGRVRFDFRGEGAHPAVVVPQVADYHLNKGAVSYHKVQVMRTVTVIGQLLDERGKPLPGAMVINHASRGVSEADGFFAVEMSHSNPSLEVRHHGKRRCLVNVDPARAKREQDVLMVGKLTCSQTTVAGAAEGGQPDV